MNYRIVKKHYRESKTNKWTPYFQIQKFTMTGMLWWKKMDWCPVTKRMGVGEDSWRVAIEFFNEKEAREYVKNLTTKQPKEEVLKV